MNDCIELLRQSHVEIVAPAFGLGAVNYSDRALQARLAQQFCRVVSLAQVQPETRNSRRVEKLLVAVAHPWAHAATLGWIAPVARGSRRAGIRAEADESPWHGVAVGLRLDGANRLHPTRNNLEAEKHADRRASERKLGFALAQRRRVQRNHNRVYSAFCHTTESYFSLKLQSKEEHECEFHVCLGE